MNYRIETTINEKDIIPLWQEAFGDKAEYIHYFISNCKNKKFLGLYRNSELLSMLFLIDCTYDGYSGAYVYAVATKKSEQKKGHMGKLLNTAKTMKYDFLCLTPAEDYLENIYAKFGFKQLLFGCEIKKTNQIIGDIKPLDVSEYLSLRKERLEKNDIPFVSFIDEEYPYNENITFAKGAFGIFEGELLVIRDNYIIEAIEQSNCIFTRKTGMIYSKNDMRNGYFTLNLG